MKKYEIKKKIFENKKYYNNGKEAIAIDSLNVFIKLKKYRHQCDRIIEIMYNILDKTNDESILSKLEDIAIKYIGYSENGYGKDINGKSFIYWKLQTFNMPKEIEMSIINLEKSLVEENKQNTL